MKRRARMIPCCVLCGNLEDLARIADRTVCRACRTCPHGWVYSYEETTACPYCLRDLFAIFSFVGPVIVDALEYVDTAHALALPLLWWSWEEEQAGDEAFSARERERSRERGSATVPGTVASAFERNAPFPYPLLHHLSRERILSGPSGSSSK